MSRIPMLSADRWLLRWVKFQLQQSKSPSSPSLPISSPLSLSLSPSLSLSTITPYHTKQPQAKAGGHPSNHSITPFTTDSAKRKTAANFGEDLRDGDVLQALVNTTLCSISHATSPINGGEEGKRWGVKKEDGDRTMRLEGEGKKAGEGGEGDEAGDGKKSGRKDSEGSNHGRKGSGKEPRRRRRIDGVRRNEMSLQGRFFLSSMSLLFLFVLSRTRTRAHLYSFFLCLFLRLYLLSKAR